MVFQIPDPVTKGLFPLSIMRPFQQEACMTGNKAKMKKESKENRQMLDH